MEDNIYKTPESDLVVEGSEGGSTVSHEFYVVALKKFLILNIVTFSFYTVYWFYRNWKLQKLHNGLSVIPVLRAIFPIFFVHSLFNEVRRAQTKNRNKYDWNPVLWASLYVVIAIVSAVFDRIYERMDLGVWGELISVLFIPLSIAVLIIPQKAINISVGDAFGEANKRLTWANYAWLIPCVILWLLVLVAFYSPYALDGA